MKEELKGKILSTLLLLEKGKNKQTNLGSSIALSVWGFLCVCGPFASQKGCTDRTSASTRADFFPPHADIQSFIYFSKSVKNQLDSARKVYHQSACNQKQQGINKEKSKEPKPSLSDDLAVAFVLSFGKEKRKASDDGNQAYTPSIHEKNAQT